MRKVIPCTIGVVLYSALSGGAPPVGGGEKAAKDGPPAGTIIVLNKSDATATLIDRATGDTVATVPTGNGPHEVAVSPDGRTAVVGNYGDRTPGNSLTIIDLQRAAVVRTIDLGDYQRPHGIEFLADGRRVVVTAEANKALLIVDIEAARVLKTIDTSQEISHMVALSPSGERAFVANIRSGSVTVADLKEGKTIKIIETGAGAEGLDISPDGREVWAANRSADTLTIIDAEKLTVLETLPCGRFPIRVKFTPDGKHVLVSNARSGDVAVFDARQRKEVRRVAMEMESVENKDQRLFGSMFGDSPVPIGLLIPPDGRHAYVANTNADLVSVIDLKEWRVVARLKPGREPDGLGYSPLVLKN